MLKFILAEWLARGRCTVSSPTKSSDFVHFDGLENFVIFTR